MSEPGPWRQFRGQTTDITTEIRRNLDAYTDSQILQELIQNVSSCVASHAIVSWF